MTNARDNDTWLRDLRAGGAQRDAALADLLRGVETEHPALEKMLGEMADRASEIRAASSSEGPGSRVVPEVYQVVVECEGEADQRRVFDRMTEEGYRCRVLTL